MLRRLMCGVGKKQIHDMSLNNEPSAALQRTLKLTHQNHNTMKATNLGIWYRQIPSGIIVNPFGEIIEPKFHHGSWYVVVDRKMKAVSKLPQLDFRSAMKFKEIFVD